MAVTRDEITRIAALARLAIGEAQMDGMVTELNSILAHMDVLQQVKVDRDAVPAPGETPRTPLTPLRADRGPPIPLGRPLESFAPNMREGFLLVPRLDTHGDAAPEDAG